MMSGDDKKPNRGLPTRKAIPSSKTIGETKGEAIDSTFGSIVGKYIDSEKKSGVKRPRTLYINDDVWTPAHGLLKAKISDFVEECLIAMLKTANKQKEEKSETPSDSSISRGRNNFR